MTRELSATVTFALRMTDGRFIAEPKHGQLGTYSLEFAQLWVWPVAESDDARAARIAAVCKIHPWAGPLTATRARP